MGSESGEVFDVDVVEDLLGIDDLPLNDGDFNGDGVIDCGDVLEAPPLLIK